MKKSDNLSNSFAWMTVGSIGNKFFRAIISIFLPKLLGVNLYGVMNLAGSIQEIAGAAQLGCIKGLQIILPQLFGEAKYKEYKKVTNIVLTMGIIILIPVILFLFVMKFFNISPFDKINYLILALISGALVVNISCQVVINDLLAQGKYIFRSKWQIIVAFFSSILVLPAAYFFKLEGVMLASFLVQFLCLLFVLYLIKFKFIFATNFSIFFNVVLKGLAIELITFTYKSFKNLDLLFIGIFLVVSSVGIYGFAYTAVMSVSLLVDPAMLIVKREVIFKHANDGDIEKIFNDLIGYPLLTYMAILFMSMIGAFFLIKVIIDLYLTEFESSFYIFCILLLGVPSLKIRGFFLPIYAAIDNLWPMTKVHVFILVIKILFLTFLFNFSNIYSENILAYLAFGNIFLVNLLMIYMSFDVVLKYPSIKKTLFFNILRLIIIFIVLSYYCISMADTLNYSNFGEVEIFKLFAIIFMGLVLVVALFYVLFREYNFVGFISRIIKANS